MAEEQSIEPQSSQRKSRRGRGEKRYSAQDFRYAVVPLWPTRKAAVKTSSSGSSRSRWWRWRSFCTGSSRGPADSVCRRAGLEARTKNSAVIFFFRKFFHRLISSIKSLFHPAGCDSEGQRLASPVQGLTAIFMVDIGSEGKQNRTDLPSPFSSKKLESETSRLLIA